MVAAGKKQRSGGGRKAAKTRERKEVGGSAAEVGSTERRPSDEETEDTGDYRQPGSEASQVLSPSNDGVDAEQLPEVTREQVLGACARVSGAMFVGSLLLRPVVGLSGPKLLGTDPEAVERLLQLPSTLDPSHLLAALATAAAVTATRTALLQVWPEFAAATDKSNKQVLTPLQPADLAVVAFLPGIAEESLFRGALIPGLFPDWRGALLSGVIFGALHNNGGRNVAFSVWASAVGALYGALFLYTEDVTSPILAHSLANLASAVLWLQLRKDGTEQQ